MKILLGNNSYDILAGSEMWSLTMAKELVRLGHQVSAYSDKLGFIAMKMEEVGVKCHKNLESDQSLKPFNIVLEEVEDYDFDVIICNHHHITGYLRNKFPNTPIIATIHGILHKDKKTEKILPEHPNLEAKVDQFVGVSEEIQMNLKDNYGLEAVIIKNPFDLGAFKRQDFNPKIKGILINSNYQNRDSDLTMVIKEVSDHYNAELKAVGVNFQPTYEVEEIVKDVDIVVGMGRSVLEGVAMGKLGLCHGRWGTGGVICPDTLKNISRFNFSGRNSTGKVMTSAEMIEQIDKYYTKENADAMYEYIKKEHDVKVVVQKYLEIAIRLCA